MRLVTRQIAFDHNGWTPDRAAKVADLFDGLAADWHTRMTADRIDAVTDVLARGGPFPAGPVLELGSGIGMFTKQLSEALGQPVATDLSAEMLARAPAAVAPRVRADASKLPYRDGAFAVVVLINMFLFPAEMDRVLRPDGVLIWVNTHGPATPIHLAAGEVDDALPGAWRGVHSEAGWGTWAALRRA